MPGAEPDGTIFVVDASVVVRWIVPEEGSEEAMALLDRPLRWLAPRLMLTETAGALRRKVDGGQLRPEQAPEALTIVMDAVSVGTIRLAAEEEVMPAALMLALSLDHKLPDCVYLALAERTGAGLATADRRLGVLAGLRGVTTILMPSA